MEWAWIEVAAVGAALGGRLEVGADGVSIWGVSPGDEGRRLGRDGRRFWVEWRQGGGVGWVGLVVREGVGGGEV